MVLSITLKLSIYHYRKIMDDATVGQLQKRIKSGIKLQKAMFRNKSFLNIGECEKYDKGVDFQKPTPLLYLDLPLLPYATYYTSIQLAGKPIASRIFSFFIVVDVLSK